VDHRPDDQQTLEDDKQIDDFEQWLKDLQSTPVDTDYNKLTDKILEIIDKPQITRADYLSGNYFAPIFTFLESEELPENTEKN